MSLLDLIEIQNDELKQSLDRMNEEVAKVKAENKRLEIIFHNAATLLESLPQGVATKRKVLAELRKAQTSND